MSKKPKHQKDRAPKPDPKPKEDEPVVKPLDGENPGGPTPPGGPK